VISGDTGVFSWTPGGSANDYAVFIEQSSDQSDWINYVSYRYVSNPYEQYSLPQGYYYRFFVASYYGESDDIRVDSGYSSAEYVYYI
jgi:hypothetical protein